MKENGKYKLTPLYLFFGSILALIVLPKLLMTLMMLGAGKALSAFQSGFCHYLGYVVGGALFYFALSVNRKPLKAVKDILFGGLCLLAIRQVFFLAHNFGPLSTTQMSTPALVADIVLLVLEAMLFAYLLFVWVIAIRDGEDSLGIGKRFLLALKGIKEILLCAFIYGVLNFGGDFLSDMLLTGLGKSRSVTAFFVKLTLLAFIIFAALCPAIYLMQKKADGLLALGEGEKPEEAPVDPESGANDHASKEVKRLFPTPALISIGAALLTVIILNVIPFFFVSSRSAAVLNSLGSGMADSFNYAAKRDYLMALKSVDKAQALPNAWKAYLDGDPEAAKAAYELGRNLSMAELLYYYTLAENPAKAEGQIAPDVTPALRSHEGDEVWYFGYLEILSKKDTLTETERQEKKRVIMELAAGNRFNCAAILPSDLTQSERNEVSANLGAYDTISESYADRIGVWEIFELCVERDGVDNEVASRLLELAKEYPASEEIRELVYSVILDCLKDYKTNSKYVYYVYERSSANNIVLGLIDAANEKKESFALGELAIRAAQQFMLNDRSLDYSLQNSIREKTYPVILNFDRLFDNEFEKDTDLAADEKAEVRIVHFLDMAQVMTDMEYSEELQEYLENALKTVSDERIESLLGAVALKNSDFDTALPILEKEYEADKDDLELTVELAILYFREGEITKSLEKAVSFTEGMLAPGVLEEKPQLGTDFTALVATYITGDKSVLDKSYGKHCAYESFTDEQKEIVESSALLSKMLDCEYRYQFKLLSYLTETGGDEGYRKMEEDALKFTEDYPLLSTGYYLAGRICGHYARGFRDDPAGRKAQEELIDLDRAIELYKKCLSFEDDQPAVLYSLALTLDHEQRYEEALEACDRAIDHGYYDSWYARWGDEYHGWGILEYATNLRNSIQSKLNQNR